jgi:acetylornithine deacetylase
MTEDLNMILDRLDEEDVIRLLTEAVEQYSPSFAEEPAMEVFAARLRESGISYLRQPVAEAGAPVGDHRANLIIELGPQPSSLMWVGHVDTVPIIDEEEQRTHREGDILHGLGTADMKSGCAAMVEAVVAIVQSGVELKRGLTVALVVGEEEYGDGSEALLETRSAPLTVIGEPTGLLACVDHYGYYECRKSAPAPFTPCWSGCGIFLKPEAKPISPRGCRSTHAKSAAGPACSWWPSSARRSSTSTHRRPSPST